MAACSPITSYKNPLTFNSSAAKINFVCSRSTAFPSHLHRKPSLHTSFKPPQVLSVSAKYRKSHQTRSTTVKSLFTGIVEEMGTVTHLGFDQNESFSMKIHAKTILEDIHLGDSISINGTCLTVTEFDTLSSEFCVGLSPETLRKTSLGELEKGSSVNLERALSPSTRIGGHFVQGHVDCTGEIMEMTPEGDSLWVKVRVDKKELLKYIVPKGFISLDGTSLTVVDVSDEEDYFNFMLVVYTQQKIVIPLKKLGRR